LVFAVVAQLTRLLGIVLGLGMENMMWKEEEVCGVEERREGRRGEATQRR
jgi:hypothetical protein